MSTEDMRGRSPLTALKEWHERTAAGESIENIICDKYRGVSFVPKRTRLAEAIDHRAQRLREIQQYHMGD